MQPLETRAAGASLNVASNMIFTLVIGQCFVTMLCSMEWGVFLFFAAIVLTMMLWTIFFLPETKGSSLENTFRLFGNNWFWGKKTAVGEIHQELPQHDVPKEGYENGAVNGNGVGHKGIDGPKV